MRVLFHVIPCTVKPIIKQTMRYDRASSFELHKPFIWSLVEKLKVIWPLVGRRRLVLRFGGQIVRRRNFATGGRLRHKISHCNAGGEFGHIFSYWYFSSPIGTYHLNGEISWSYSPKRLRRSLYQQQKKDHLNRFINIELIHNIYEIKYSRINNFSFWNRRVKNVFTQSCRLTNNLVEYY